MRKLWMIVLLGSMVAMVPSAGLANSEDVTLEVLVVEMADTPAEHEALARYYRAKAVGLRSDAEMHRNMAKRYTAGNVASRRAMSKHCENIAQQDDKTAAEYDALAQGHEDQAKAQ